MDKNSKIFLKDDEVLYLTKGDYKKVINNIDLNTQWNKVYFKEVTAIGLDNIPILIESQKKDNKINSCDEVITSCMENAGICLQFPVNNKPANIPVSTNGYPGVVARAGFSGPALNYADSNKRNPMPPKERANVINAGLATYKDIESSFGYVLCRYERVDAFHSAEYSVLPVSELLMQMEDSLDFNYSDWEFIDGSVSPSFTSLRWQINDTALLSDIKKILKKKQDFKVGIVLLTSDTGTSSAKTFLVLQGANGFPILVGRPQCLPHKYGAVANDFSKCTNAIASSVRDVVALVQALTQKKCLHIGGAIRLFANKLRLPKKIAMAVAEEYSAGYPQGASFYEVFIALQDIIYLYQKDAVNKETVTPEKVFELSEAVASMLYIEHISEYDRNFEWAE